MSENNADRCIVVAEIRTTGGEVDVSELVQVVAHDDFGAIVSFQGAVRGIENGRQIRALDYEHHPVMAPRELRRVLARAVSKFDLGRVGCIHRVGTVAVGDTAVAIAVSASHREAAFDGCRFIIDELKRSVPIWKRPVFAEVTSDSGDGNETGSG